MKTNLEGMKCKKRKRSVVADIVGDGKVLKKYKVFNEMKQVVSFRFARYCARNRYNNERAQKVLQNKVIHDVKKFLEEDEHSRVAPGKKDCVTRKKIKKQKRYLNEPMKKLYPKFVSSCGYKISYSFF